MVGDEHSGFADIDQVVWVQAVLAIDIDAYDDVWVLDSDNVIHEFIKSTGYTEKVVSSFDIDVVTDDTFTGYVYDFVINFYNEAFYFFTNDPGKGSIWRIECDGTYYSVIELNPNPVVNVLAQASTNDTADIAIDNLDAAGNPLTGLQDSQIVLAGGTDDMFFYTSFTRINAKLGNVVALPPYDGWGASCLAFDQLGNKCLAWTSDSGTWTNEWTPNSTWY